MQICSWVWCSFVLQIPSFTAVVFHFHVDRDKFSEAGDRPWIPILMWIYIFLYLPEKCLLELNNSYLWGCYLSMLTRQYWKQPCSSFKHNIFFLELELSFQISIWRYRIGFSSLLRPPGHCGDNNHNHRHTKDMQSRGTAEQHFFGYRGEICLAMLCAPQERKL